MQRGLYHCIDCKAEYEPRPFLIAMQGLYCRPNDELGYCPSCRTAGLERQDEHHKAEEAAKLAAIAPKRRMWRQTCGITPFYMGKDFHEFKRELQPNAYDVAYQYAKDFPLGKPRGYSSLVFYSEKRGLGKTHLAAGILHGILDRWDGEDILRPGYFISEEELIMSIQATFSLSYEDRQMRESETNILMRLAAEPLLILDEVGQVERKDMRFVREKLHYLIQRRYDARLPMVVTTNKNSAALEEYLGTTTFERLLEMSGRKFIELTGTSYRRVAHD